MKHIFIVLIVLFGFSSGVFAASQGETVLPIDDSAETTASASSPTRVIASTAIAGVAGLPLGYGVAVLMNRHLYERYGTQLIPFAFAGIIGTTCATASIAAFSSALWSGTPLQGALRAALPVAPIIALATIITLGVLFAILQAAPQLYSDTGFVLFLGSGTLTGIALASFTAGALSHRYTRNVE